MKTKRLDLRAQNELRRAEQLQLGYDSVLASMDLVWHYHCHKQLENAGRRCPFDLDKEFPEIRDNFNNLLQLGIDSLKKHSRHYENVATTLQWIILVVWEGRTLGRLESRHNDYQEVRDMLIKCSRIDDRNDDPLKRRFWKKVAREYKPKSIDELPAEEKLSRAYAELNAAYRGTYHVVFSNETDESTEMALAFLKSLEEIPKEFIPSLAATGSRIDTWKDRGVISFDTPCTLMEQLCHKAYRE